MHVGTLGFKLRYPNSKVYLCSGIQRGRLWKERGLRPGMRLVRKRVRHAPAGMRAVTRSGFDTDRKSEGSVREPQPGLCEESCRQFCHVRYLSGSGHRIEKRAGTAHRGSPGTEDSRLGRDVEHKS